MKNIKPSVWAIVFAGLCLIGLCVFLPAKVKQVKQIQTQTKTQPAVRAEVSVEAQAQETPKVSVATVDPKADERAVLLAQLGFSANGGHKVSVVYTNTSVAKNTVGK